MPESFLPVPEQLLRLSIDEHYFPVGVCDHDGVRGRLEERSKALLVADAKAPPAGARGYHG